MLVDRIIKVRLQLDALDDKLTSGDWTAHDQRTYGALLNAQRLCLRELGLGPAPRLMLNRAGHGSQMGAQSTAQGSLSPLQAYQLMIAGGDPKLRTESEDTAGIARSISRVTGAGSADRHRPELAQQRKRAPE